MTTAETASVILGHFDPKLAAQLMGAVDAMRQREGRPRAETVEQELQRHLSEVRAELPADQWEQHHRLGRKRGVEDLLTRVRNQVPH
jgi:hypothetical protein